MAKRLSLAAPIFSRLPEKQWIRLHNAIIEAPWNHHVYYLRYSRKIRKIVRAAIKFQENNRESQRITQR